MNTRSFSVEKALQTLAYLQRKTKEHNYLKLLKYLYFAERYSLRYYASPIVFDHFCAMHNGPVASNTYNIIKRDDYYLSKLSSEERSLVERSILVNREAEKVSIIGIPKQDLLSDADIEALDFALSTFSQFGRNKLIHLAHQFPEWKKFEKELGGAEYMKKRDMCYEDFFSNPSSEGSEALGSSFSSDPFEMDQRELSLAKSVFAESLNSPCTCRH